MPPGAAPPRDPNAEDFLFHLYRGSELLQDNRVLEAKEELESALMLQPRDAKGQDLLAVVYFRIGHFPRAIQIYEQLKTRNPKDPALKLNLALCYLKTGDAGAARVELEELVAKNPGHKRAWGYLGLAYERLDDFIKAEDAFDRGGHTQMARRMGERRAAPRSGPDVAALSRRTPAPQNASEARDVISIAFEELDAGELSFSLAAPVKGGGEPSSWQTVELGATPVPPRPLEPLPLSVRTKVRLEAGAPSVREPARTAAAADAPVRASEPVLSARAPYGAPLLRELVRSARAEFSASTWLSLLPSGIALVQTATAAEASPERAFAVRLEAVRSLGGAVTTAVLERHSHGRPTGEPFGSVGSPLVRVSGAGQLVLGPRPSHLLAAFRIDDGAACIGEDHLLGFDLTLAFENSQLVTGEGDSAPIVTLRGSGAVLLELMGQVVSLDVTETRSVSVRREVILGWIGKIVPRALPSSEAPCGQRGLISFAGEGTILICAT